MHCFIEEISTPQLVAIYNKVAGKKVKKFESRRAGMKRVAGALVEKYDATAASNNSCVYAPAGMQFDIEKLDFVPRPSKEKAETATIVEKDTTRVEDHTKTDAKVEKKTTIKTGIVPKDLREKSSQKAVASEKPVPAVKTDLPGDVVVKTSGNPVKKEGGSPAKGRRLGIGKRMEQLLVEGIHAPKEIVARIHEEFPSSRATTKDVYLVRSRMNEAA